MLRTLSFLLVLFLAGSYLYIKVSEDVAEAATQVEVEQLAKTEGGLGLYGGFSILPLENNSRATSNRRVPLSSGKQHLFFRADEFLYSENSYGRTEIFLSGSSRGISLEKSVHQDTIAAQLRAAGLRVGLGKSHVLNLDAVRMMESQQAYNKKSYKYYARMVNGDTVTISKDQYPILRAQLAE